MNPNSGWEIRPREGAELRRTEAGRFALDMEITSDGRHVAYTEHVYTGDQIEQIFSQMRTLIARGARVVGEDRAEQKAEMGQAF